MMTQMVRKQIYIQKRQNLLLKRLAQARGVSEAEVIRQALEREFTGENKQVAEADVTAMEDFLEFAISRRTLPRTGKPYQWNRQEIYEERESRWFRDREE